MSMNLTVEKYSCETEHLIAGATIPITTAVKETAEAIRKGAVVALNAEGKVKTITAASGGSGADTNGIYGIASEDFKSGEEAVIYLSGEFFADAVVLPVKVTAADVEIPLRNIGIYLK